MAFGVLFLTGIPLLALFLPDHWLPRLRLVSILCQISALLLLALPQIGGASLVQGGFDQLSLVFLLFTIIVILAVLLTKRDLPKHQVVALAFLQLSLEIVFMTSHLITFYGFWSIANLPIAWLLIRDKKPQAPRFILSAFLGTIPLLFLIYRVYVLTGSWQITTWTTFEPEVSWQLFVALVLTFGVRLGLFPFHGWLIDGSRYPAAIAALILGPFAKAGLYGLLRIGTPIMYSFSLSLPMTLGILGLVSVLYGCIIGLTQQPGRQAAAWMCLVYGGFALLFLATPGLSNNRTVLISVSSSLAVTLYLLSPPAHWYRNVSLLSLMALPGLGGFDSFTDFFQTIGAQDRYIRYPSVAGFLMLLSFAGLLLQNPRPTGDRRLRWGSLLLLVSLAWISFAGARYEAILPPL